MVYLKDKMCHDVTHEFMDEGDGEGEGKGEGETNLTFEKELTRPYNWKDIVDFAERVMFIILPAFQLAKLQSTLLQYIQKIH